jgi:indole-3-glycerol phosphate synthase
MPVTLDEILTSTRGRLELLRKQKDVLARQAAGRPRPASLRSELTRAHVALVAEVKRRSPSAGVIREDLDPAARAELYAKHGAAAISVLTDGPYFGGSLADLALAVQRVRVPVLRKDFILDEVQILEARATGAAAVLLIVRALSASRLAELLRSTREWLLEAVVEVHTRAELDLALEAGAEIIGVNSRDLDSFHIDTERAWEILEQVPGDRVAVAESGMSRLVDVERAAAAGADAGLVGTALSAEKTPEVLLQTLCGVRRRVR